MVLKKRKRAASFGGGGGGGGGASPGRKAGRKRASAAEAAAEDAAVASDDELPSSSDNEGAGGPDGAAGKGEAEDDEFFETPDEKRIRLAKEYLGRIGAEDGEKGKEEVQEQLVRDVEEQARRSRLQIEDLTLGEPVLRRRAHGRALTCVCLSSDDSTAYTGSKDCHVARWDVETGQYSLFPGGRNRFQCGGHFQKVLGLCLVEPRGLLVSGGVDRVVRLWDPRAPASAMCKETLQGHLGPVTAVAAEEDGSVLYTASMDKSLKLWDLRTRRCTDTLFGHVSGIVNMDLYGKGRPVTGGVDKTVRLWKVDRETHLVFNRHTYSADAVTVVDHERFLSGGQDGNLFLWSHASKKPLASASLPATSSAGAAAGADSAGAEGAGVGGGRWISALRAVRRGNVVFSGSVDGLLRSWQFGRGLAAGGAEEDKSLRLTEVRPPLAVPGCINAIAAGRKVLALAIGKEHRLGRWFYERQHKNGLMLVPLSYRES